jgi:hypothetical protein
VPVCSPSITLSCPKNTFDRFSRPLACLGPELTQAQLAQDYEDAFAVN